MSPRPDVSMVSEEFLALYNKLDHNLMRFTATNERTRFGDRLSLAAPRNTAVADNLYTLIDFGSLRNFVWHQRGEIIDNWAEPTTEALTYFRSLVEAIISPEPLLPRFARELRVFSPDEPIADALTYMRANDFSQVVVRDSAGHSLMSVEGVARWLEGAAHDDLVSIRETTVGAVATHEPEWTLVRVSRKATIEDARCILIRHQGGTSPRVFAVLISSGGRANETPHGIVTPWDL